MSEIFRTTKDTQRLDFFFDDNHDDHDIDEAWNETRNISQVIKTTKVLFMTSPIVMLIICKRAICLRTTEDTQRKDLKPTAMAKKSTNNQY